MAQTRNALGKGFGALIPSAPPESEFSEISIEKIIPNRYQPRTEFRPAELSELASSLKNKGVIQPVVVRKSGEGRFELIAGERRWRAAQMAGLATLPAWIREVSDGEMLEWALIENLHREDLNPIETAKAYRRLMNERGWTQEQVAERVGQERSTVSNVLRLLQLPGEIQAHLIEGVLSMGHAKAILSSGGREAQLSVWRRIVGEGLTVRQAEAASRRRPRSAKGAAGRTAELADLEERLSRSLKTKVRVRTRKKGGELIILYYNLDELDRLMDRLL